MHQNSPYWEPKSKKKFWGGVQGHPLPSPHIPHPSAPSAPRSSRLRRLVLPSAHRFSRLRRSAFLFLFIYDSNNGSNMTTYRLSRLHSARSHSTQLNSTQLASLLSVAIFWKFSEHYQNISVWVELSRMRYMYRALRWNSVPDARIVMSEWIAARADCRVGVQRAVFVAVILPLEWRDASVVPLHDLQQFVAHASH